MTVSSVTTKKSYNGDGSTTVFAYDFKIFDDDDITVIIKTDSTGAEAVKTKTTHYTVSGVGVTTGGNITFGSAPVSGETVVLLRSTAQTQTTDYTPNDPFPAASHEDALDKLTFIAQEIAAAINGIKALVELTKYLVLTVVVSFLLLRARLILCQLQHHLCLLVVALQHQPLTQSELVL